MFGFEAHSIYQGNVSSTNHGGSLERSPAFHIHALTERWLFPTGTIRALNQLIAYYARYATTVWQYSKHASFFSPRHWRRVQTLSTAWSRQRNARRTCKDDGRAPQLKLISTQENKTSSCGHERRRPRARTLALGTQLSRRMSGRDAHPSSLLLVQ